MPNLNSCSFMGNIGKIETKFTASGDPVTSISLAVNESWKDKQGQKQEHTEWVRATAFGKLAGIMQQYVKKGDPLYISGKMKTDKYQGQDGQDKWSTGIIIREMQMIGGKQDSGAPSQNQSPQQPVQEEASTDDGFENIPFIDPYKFTWMIV